MSAIKQIKASARPQVGKGAARAVRRAGQVPAVIYGAGVAPEAITLDYKTTHKLIFSGHFLTTIFEIDVDGRKVKAIPRDYQLDVVRDFPMHVDFLRLAEGSMIKVEVPVHVVGQDVCPGIKRGGAMQLVEHAVELNVLADQIPDFIEVSVAGLNLGQSVHLADITLPAGAKPVTRENLTLVSIVAPTGMKEAEEDTAAAAAASAASTAAKAAPAKG
jgi:large subunit ribosomal protein L25